MCARGLLWRENTQPILWLFRITATPSGQSNTISCFKMFDSELKCESLRLEFYTLILILPVLTLVFVCRRGSRTWGCTWEVRLDYTTLIWHETVLPLFHTLLSQLCNSSFHVFPPLFSLVVWLPLWLLPYSFTPSHLDSWVGCFFFFFNSSCSHIDVVFSFFFF